MVYRWTSEQDAIIRRLYPDGGYRAVQAEIPDAMATQISSHARHLKVARKDGVRRVKCEHRKNASEMNFTPSQKRIERMKIELREARPVPESTGGGTEYGRVVKARRTRR